MLSKDEEIASLKSEMEQLQKDSEGQVESLENEIKELKHTI